MTKNQKEMRKVLVTDYVHDALIEGLVAQGYAVDYERSISRTEAIARMSEYEGIVVNSKVRMTRDAIAAGEQLRWIARLGSGLDIIDLDYAAERGVAVLSSPEGNRNAVAEHAMGMLLALSNKLLQGDRQVRAMAWDRESCRGWELMGKTIGIVGLGHAGGALASKLRGWGMRVLAFDPEWPVLMPGYDHVERVDLAYLQQEADIISFHVQLTPSVEGMVDDDFLAKCVDGVIILNTSRGKVVQLPDLLAHLQSGKIAGACLDVFPNEKTASYTSEEVDLYEQLFSMPNVILSPHVAGWTNESLRRIADVLLLKISGLTQ